MLGDGRVCRVVVVASDRLVFEVFRRQLLDFFGSAIDIEEVVLEEWEPKPLQARIVVASCNTVADRIRAYLAPDAQLLVACRAIDPANLEELLRLPPNTRVLLVSNFMETALDTIQMLKRHGLTHLEWKPYVPGAGSMREEADVAVTCGLPHLVPRGVSRVVNIGVRKLDVSTLVALQLAAGVPVERINYISIGYLDEIVKTTRKYLQEAERAARLGAQLEAILDSIGIGVVGADLRGLVTFCNSEAHAMLGAKPGETVGRAAREVLPQVDWEAEGWKEGSGVQVVEAAGNRLAVSVLPVTRNGEMFGSVAILRRVTEVQSTEAEVRWRLTRSGYLAKYRFEDIIGMSDVMARLKSQAMQLAASELPVLIVGETGTGKELFAHAIHQASRRRDGPFVAINFAAVPESLVESELFGYEEGAFTGARKGGKPGLFEQAHRGTLFLDEVAEAPPSIQARLLRVLEEKRVLRVGGSRMVPVDVRIIAATNRDLVELMRSGRFRPDLYFRLHVLPLHIPPLRSRPQDIPDLIRHFMSEKGYRFTLDASALDILMSYHWPGNVRELENLLAYLAVTCGAGIVSASHLRALLLPDHSRPEPAGGLDAAYPVEELASRLAASGCDRLAVEVLIRLHSDSQVGRRSSRRRILSQLKQRGYDVSEGRLRSLLQLFAQYGCVQPGPTRRGTAITPKGYKLLRLLDSEVREPESLTAWRA
ncbi:MAG: sigma 54-interacting transcriptional regulator [Bacillota bacterium]